MKSVQKLVLSVSALSALASVAHAQNSASVTASGNATVIQPMYLTSSTNLNFGTIVKPGTGTATVAVDASGNRTLTGTVGAPNAGGISAAAFAVAGEGGQTFSLTMPSTFTIATTTGGGGTLTVSTINGLGANTGTLSGSIGSQGSLAFGVGGQFALPSTAASGAYTGNFTVTTAYN